MYDRHQIVTLYQENPPYLKKHAFKLKGWTDTILGYLNEADKLCRCIMRNRRLMGRNYTWAVGINIRAELSPEAIKDLWTHVCGVLKKKGVVALWVREPSRSNHCNYHLIVKNPMPQLALERAIDESLRDKHSKPLVSYHKHVRLIRSQYYYPRYITKAKTRGYVKNRLVADKYKDKRLLFRPKLGLQKARAVGDFWEKPKEELWQEIRDIEKRIADGLAKPNVKKLARHIYDLFGENVPLHRIERSLGYFADEPPIRAWIEELFGTDDVNN